MDAHEASKHSRELPDVARPRWRWGRLWFPLMLIAVAAAGLWVFWQSDYDRDIKLVVRTAAIGLTALACGIWFVACGPFSRRIRWLVVLSPVALLVAFFVLFQPEHDGDMQFYWFDLARYKFRWGADPDEQLQVPDVARVAEGWETTPFDYPRFLGPGGRGEVRGVRLATDWERQRPQELWRREIGAGWSAFAVVGDYAITQEQRGDYELVVCYRVQDGEIIWTHSDRTRFDPSHLTGQLGDVGPRATPAIERGKVVTHGATGIVNCLEARTGKVLWSVDTLREFGGEIVRWGKSSSPLILGDRVVLSIGAPSGKSLVAFDLQTGDVAWSAGVHRSSYASPVEAVVAGVSQVISVDEDYVTAVDAADGRLLWEYEWPGSSDANASVSQPVPVSGDRVFLSKGYGVGAELIQVSRGDSEEFTATRVWKSSRVMKTKMSNVVLRDGYVYGLDGGILQCIELATGRQMWKVSRGRYGHGQIMLVGDVILVMTEMQGDVVLVRAQPDAFDEVARLRVFKKGQKTWNNPALAGRHLLLRNNQEAVCYRVPLVEEPEANDHIDL